MKKKVEFREIERINPNYLEGLNDSQVSERIEAKLVNKTKSAYGKSYKEIVFTNLFSFFNVLLYIIAGFMIFAGHYSGLFFLAILIPNILIGLIQDLRARRTVAKLKLLSSSKITVIRNGNEEQVDSSEIVLDDIIKLRNSDPVPTDGKVVYGTLAVNESMLTGESANVYKKEGDDVLSGSYVTSGTAYIHVEKVGKDSYIENLQSQANKFARSPSKILNSLRSMFKVIGFTVVILAIALIITYAAQGKFSNLDQTKESIASIAGSMVSMIPSGLYLLTSVALAAGVLVLAKKRTSVQEMYSIEMLARTDVLCVDKTGTITDGTMQVKLVVPFDSRIGIEQLKQAVSNLLIATQDDNITAKALKEYFNYKQTCVASKVLPFSSENKYSAATLAGRGTFVLGALEFLNLKNKKGIAYKTLEYTSKGYRVLVLGYSKLPITSNKFDQELEPLCMIILKDNIRPDAKETFTWFKEKGVQVKVISGDDALTVSEISKEAGIENAEEYISLNGLSLDEVRKIAPYYTVFGRVSPEQKEVLIQALKDEGHTVAMTGDGVNDILALKRADCSIAMNSGSSAAKNVSHIVLLDSDFSKLPSVVGEGRRVINNLQRTCSLFLVKTIFAMVLTVFFLVLSWTDKTYSYPFVTNNMYPWEIVTIGIAAFFLALQPNKEKINGNFMKNIFAKAIPAGICSILIVIIFFTLYLLGKEKIFYSGLIYQTVEVNGDVVDVALRQTISMSVIGFSLFSFVSLFRIILPPNKYRISVFIGAFVMVAAIFVIDIFWNINTRNFPGGPTNILKIDYQYLNAANFVVLFNVVAIISAIYLTVNYIVSVIKRKEVKADDKN